MYKGAEIIAFTDKHKSFIWGLFLSTIIFKFAIGNIFFGLMIALFLFRGFQTKKIIGNKSLLPIGLFFGWGMMSLLWTTNLSATISGIGLILPLLLIPLFIYQYKEFNIEDLSIATKVFSISLLIYFLVCIINALVLFLDDGHYFHFFYHDLVSVFDNHAIYISLAIAMCVLVTFNLPQKTIKDYLTIFFLSIFLLLLSSKNIIIITFLLVVLTLLINKNKLKFILLISFIASALVFVIAISNNPIKERFLTELNLNSEFIFNGQDFYDFNFTGTELRLFQWRVIGEMIANHQVGLFGLGLNNVDYLIEQYFSYYNLYKGYWYINFHNQYLQTLGELGFVGLGIILIVLFGRVYRAYKRKSIYEMVFILLFMTAFFTESFLSRQKGVYLFAIFYSLVSALAQKSTMVNRNKRKRL